jgi:acyl-[acyl-carrier-protein]-phospholipid O-acyltransferase/long-chain-fatty-acid--[acyl-carrier-protein] ligase
VPRKIVKIPEVPVLGTGKTDYVAIQRMAETEARAA